MSDLDQRELAQEGLKYIEDAIVGLLTRHPSGMPTAQIAETLGLRADLAPGTQNLIVAGILELLAKSGRIVWDSETSRYKDNPDQL